MSPVQLWLRPPTTKPLQEKQILRGFLIGWVVQEKGPSSLLPHFVAVTNPVAGPRGSAVGRASGADFALPPGGPQGGSPRPREARAVRAYFAAFEKAKAKERQAQAGKVYGKGKKAIAQGNFPEAIGKASDLAAAATGYSGRSLDKADAVAKAAEESPREAPFPGVGSVRPPRPDAV